MKPSTRGSDENKPVASLSASELDALRLLGEAAALAKAAGRDAWEFAMEIHLLLAAGLGHNDVRRLLCEGLIEAAEETTRPRRKKRAFRRSTNLRLTGRTCFVLTARGAAALRLASSNRVATSGQDGTATVRTDAQPHALALPHWDSARRKLFWKGHIIKQFQVPAPNQERVLGAFEEEGWPPRLDDPLPGGDDLVAKQRLHDTIKYLNRHQVERRLHFSGDGTGKGICWEPLGETYPRPSPDRP